MSQRLIFSGVVLLFVAIVLIVAGSILSAEKTEVGFGGFIGPIPFGWASNPKMLKWVILLSAIVLVSFVLLFFLK